ncbi:hypothetical protein ACH5RR_001907 [Cinchona calisaya]|uniref:Protein kinase domain-containing protein n=1 Tax=Cinchona calisaya TaxID=153742 RepID=A0ABD3B564_9GENT
MHSEFSLILFLVLNLSVLLSFPTLISSSSATVTAPSNVTTCPLNLNYVLTIPWSKDACKNQPNSITTTSQNPNSSDNCCQNLLSLFGISLANRLKQTSQFELPDLATSVSCLDEFQSKLNSLSLPHNLASLCFDPLQFVISPNMCASIQTAQDWRNKLGPSTALDSACSTDLSDCSACISAGFQVQSQLIALDGKGGFGIVYKGMLGDGTVVAVKKVIIETDNSKANEDFCNEVDIISNLKHRNLVPLRGCCMTDDKVHNDGEGESQRYLVYDYMCNGNLNDHLFPMINGETEKQLLSWQQRKSIVLDVAKRMKKALTWSSSEQATLITDWAWTMVKSGKMQEVLDQDLVKNVGEKDSVNANSINVMERFVLVGILCAHVTESLRPTVLDAIKMMEGDIEVPEIPDRPSPLLMHPPFNDNFGEGLLQLYNAI